MRARARACVRVRACVRACVRVCARARARFCHCVGMRVHMRVRAHLCTNENRPPNGSECTGKTANHADIGTLSRSTMKRFTDTFNP